MELNKHTLANNEVIIKVNLLVQNFFKGLDTFLL